MWTILTASDANEHAVFWTKRKTGGSLRLSRKLLKKAGS